MIEKTGVQHLEIEEEFEKKLLRMNGHDPFSFPIAELIPTDALTAETIHPFYCKGIDHKTVRASLRYMKLIKQFFTAPCPVKYRIIDVLMKLSGKYVSFKGLMHQRTDNLCLLYTSDAADE